MFNTIPTVLSELTPLEERMVSPRHVFLKIVRKGQGISYQYGLMGNVVNVPVLIQWYQLYLDTKEMTMLSLSNLKEKCAINTVEKK